MSDRPGAESLISRAVGVVAVVALTACAAPPQKEMDQAEGAIVTARAAGAVQYANAEFMAAEAALRRSHEAVGQRDYRQALSHAIDARERAQAAAREAADKKAIARGQAERAITAAELALAAGQQRLTAGTPAMRRVPAAVAAARKTLQTTVGASETALQEARSHLQAQRFDEALTKAQSLPEEIRAATAAFDEALTATPASRAGRRSR
jgi:hypothetical protein